MHLEVARVPPLHRCQVRSSEGVMGYVQMLQRKGGQDEWQTPSPLIQQHIRSYFQPQGKSLHGRTTAEHRFEGLWQGMFLFDFQTANFQASKKDPSIADIGTSSIS